MTPTQAPSPSTQLVPSASPILLNIIHHRLRSHHDSASSIRPAIDGLPSYRTSASSTKRPTVGRLTRSFSLPGTGKAFVSILPPRFVAFIGCDLSGLRQTMSPRRSMAQRLGMSKPVSFLPHHSGLSKPTSYWSMLDGDGVIIWGRQSILLPLLTIHELKSLPTSS